MLGERERKRNFLEHQLLPELAEDFSRFDLLIFCDARVPSDDGGDVEGYRIEEIAPDPHLEGLNIHSVGPGWSSPSPRASGGVPPSVLISVEGESFDFGDEITPECRERMERAEKAFLKWFGEKYPAKS
ncbi:hypothetical protein MASR1M66_10630 [Aminivibrio sp.]